jgi:hypothetical protein
LNDQGFYELAQAFARRVLSKSATSDADRVDYAFRLCLTRPPQPQEAEKLLNLVSTEKTSEKKWTTLCRVLLNLDETITRE